MKKRTYLRILEQEAAESKNALPGAASGVSHWSCPSNIAIVKYWGKRPVQIPMNPSLSLTLNAAITRTRITYRYEPGAGRVPVKFRFGGKESPDFAERVERYIRQVEPFLPLIRDTRMEIESSNTFPHSSGIASSASAMGALALCLADVESRLRGGVTGEVDRKKASFLARIGSGSACRSIYPGFVLWGEDPGWTGSSDEYAIPVTGLHPAFRNIKDSILLVETGRKKVSSSAGHNLMTDHPYAGSRFAQARENLERLQGVLKSGDWKDFIGLMEEEALSLHAMMMTSRPGYLLMKPGTLSILDRIRAFRSETGLRLGFTLDAGANVHLLYPEEDAGAVRSFISSDLESHCEQPPLHDEAGKGPHAVEE